MRPVPWLAPVFSSITVFCYSWHASCALAGSRVLIHNCVLLQLACVLCPGWLPCSHPYLRFATVGMRPVPWLAPVYSSISVFCYSWHASCALAGSRVLIHICVLLQLACVLCPGWLPCTHPYLCFATVGMRPVPWLAPVFSSITVFCYSWHASCALAGSRVLIHNCVLLQLACVLCPGWLPCTHP